MANQTNPQSNSPNRDDIRDLLSAYLDGEVTDAERAMVEQALAESAELRRELATLRQTVQLFSTLPQMPAPRPFTLAEADVAPINQKRRQPNQRNDEKESWLRWFPFNVGWLAAAVALLFIAFSFWQAADRVAQEQQELANAPVETAVQQEAARLPATAIPEVAAMEAPATDEPLADQAEPEAAQEETLEELAAAEGGEAEEESADAEMAQAEIAPQEAEAEEAAEESVDTFAAEAIEEEADAEMAAGSAPVEQPAPQGDAPPAEMAESAPAGDVAAESAPADEGAALRQATPAPQIEITEEPTPQPIPPAETAAPLEAAEDDAAMAGAAEAPTTLAMTAESTVEALPSPTAIVTVVSSPTIAAIIAERDDTTAALISYIWIGWIGLLVLGGVIWLLVSRLRRNQ